MPIEVQLNDNLRLAGALLAAGDWPEMEQKLKPYKPHRVAEAARRYFSAWRHLTAVKSAADQVGQGAGLADFLGQAFGDDWHADRRADLVEFAAAAQPATFWAETEADWQTSVKDLEAVFARADLGQFLADLWGPSLPSLGLAPNLLFPGYQCLALGTAGRLVVYAPPPLAWGASAPWRYSERADEVQATVCQAIAQRLFEAHMPGTPAEALALAAAVLFLRQAEGEAAGDQFMVIQKKTRGWRGLPAVVAGLAGILAARRAGGLATCDDGLPVLQEPLSRLTG